uniref:Retinol binding protein 7 n=1 Tax=Ursus americanus TaxID=9643 RepID=A0A452RQZ4_URSAM
MPADLSGTWNLLSSDNFEGYMLALGIDFATRKIAKLLKPQKVIEQDGDSFTIHTYSTLKNYLVTFKVGEEFDEDNKGLDNRKCRVKKIFLNSNDNIGSWFCKMNSAFLVPVEELVRANQPLLPSLLQSLVTWDNDRLTCVQKGEKKNRGWTHWIEGDELHLEMFCEGQVCKQTFQRA